MEHEIKHNLEDELKLIGMQIEEIEGLSNVMFSALLNDHLKVSTKDLANSVSVLCDKSEKAKNSLNEYLEKAF